MSIQITKICDLCGCVIPEYSETLRKPTTMTDSTAVVIQMNVDIVVKRENSAGEPLMLCKSCRDAAIAKVATII